MMRRFLGLGALTLAAVAPLGAQAYFYPALQPARIAEREYNFVLSDAGIGGTAMVFQWREGMGNPKLQFTLDAGFVDENIPGAEMRSVIGGGFAYQMTTARSDMPFDIALAGGLGMSFGNSIKTIRLPFGASIGHRFPLEGGFAISPFVHPRLSYNRVSVGGFTAVTNTELEVDLGANFEFKPQMAIRLATVMGTNDAVALSFAWTPRGLKK